MTLVNVPDQPEEIHEEDLVKALSVLGLVDAVTSVDDLAELHFRPHELEVVYIRVPRTGEPIRIHRVVPIRAAGPSS